MKAFTRLFLVCAIILSIQTVSFGVDYQWESAVSGDWSTVADWLPDGTPGANVNDTVTIDATGSAYTVTLDTTPTNPLTGFTLDSSDATFGAVYQTFTVNGPSTLDNGSVFWRSSKWNGSGALTNNAAMTIVGTATEINNSSFNQNGTLLIEGSSGYGHTFLTVANDLNNAGTLTMQSTGGSYYANLKVIGTLTNTSTGTININPGSGGSRTLYANLTNNGDFNVNADTTFSNTSGVYTNNNQMSIDIGKTLGITGNNQIFNQNGGTLDIDGALNLNTMSMNFTGGTITGNAPQLQNVALSISPAATGSASFLFVDDSANYLSGNVNAAHTITIQGSSSVGPARLTSAGSFSNAGTINLDSVGGSQTAYLDIISGTLTNASTGTININQGSGGVRTLRASLTNNGTVNINTNTTFNESSGVYTNNNAMNIATDKTLTITGNNQVFNQNSGTLSINGALNLTTMALNYNGGSITGNTPTLQNVTLSIGASATNPASFLFVDDSANNLAGDIHSGQTITIQPNSSAGSARLVSAGSFSNAGTINLESVGGGYSGYLDITSGTLTNASTGTINFNQGAGGGRTFQASLTNNGTVNINTNTTFSESLGTYTNNNAMNIATDKTLTITGNNQVFNQNSGTLSINGALNLTTMAMNYNGGSMTGNTPKLQNVTLSIGASATNPASFLFVDDSDNKLIGNIHSGQTITVQGNSSLGTALLRSDGSFSNAGTINLESYGGGYSSYLDITSGTLTNMPTGTINFNYGVGGGRTFLASLANNGTVNVNTNTTFSESLGTYTNNNAMNIAIDKTLTITGSNQVFNQNSGILDIDGTLKLSTMDMNFNGGAITGNAVTCVNVDLAIDPTATGAAAFRMLDNYNTLTGNVYSGQHLNVQGSNEGGGTAELDSANSFSNFGTITLDSSGGGYTSILKVTATGGTVTNTSTGIINVDYGSGGGRYFDAGLDNEGTVNWNRTGSLRKTGADHTNSGLFNIGGSVIVTVQGDSFTNEIDGVLGGIGELDISGVTFTNDGTVSPGFSPGILTIDGTYNQSSIGSLDIEIGGLTVGTQYDRLVVDGIANLDGLLEISFLNGFLPDPTDTFTILTATGLSGTFANAPDDGRVYFPGGWFEVEYTATSVILTNAVVPEPSTIALLLGILLTAPLLFRRRR